MKRRTINGRRRKKIDTAENEARGYDAVSFTRGHKRPQRGTSSRKSSSSSSGKTTTKRKGREGNKIPFWEEEGSVLSVLLGHNWDDSRPPQRSLRSNFDDVVGGFRSSKTITVFLRQILLATAKIVGSLCRWASVRDTIPRPIVFLCAIGAGFVSRPSDRIKNMLLTFLSVRVFGEWLSEPLPENANKNRNDTEIARRRKKKQQRGKSS